MSGDEPVADEPTPPDGSPAKDTTPPDGSPAKDTTSPDGSPADGSAPADQSAGATEADTDTVSLSERERLAGQVAILEAENQRLRDEYTRLRQLRYRKTAIALVGAGFVAALGGVVAPATREVLFALAGAGIFLGLLTYFLAPERFLPASVGRQVYGALATNERRVVTELGLSEHTLYVPLAGEDRVRLYVPERHTGSLPDASALTDTFVVADGHRGVSFRPTGQSLFDEFERALSNDVATTPAGLAGQLADALVEQFELVERAETTVAPDATAEAGQLSVGVVDSAYGPLDQFDHPVASFLGVAVVCGFEHPVEVRVESLTDGRVDEVVTCQWPADDERRGDERGFKHRDDPKTE